MLVLVLVLVMVQRANLPRLAQLLPHVVLPLLRPFMQTTPAAPCLVSCPLHPERHKLHTPRPHMPHGRASDLAAERAPLRATTPHPVEQVCTLCMHPQQVVPPASARSLLWVARHAASRRQQWHACFGSLVRVGPFRTTRHRQCCPQRGHSRRSSLVVVARCLVQVLKA